VPQSKPRRTPAPRGAHTTDSPAATQEGPPPDRKALDREIEEFRQLVIASRSSPEAGPAAHECQERLNAMFQEDPRVFTAEDVRWLNVLSGLLGERMEAHRPPAKHTPRAKRKGDSLTHCWRCRTTVDERFTETCEACSTKTYRWMVCPVCGACGCQRGGKKVV
jgi:hypothetical protein